MRARGSLRSVASAEFGREFQFIENVESAARRQRQHARGDFVERVLAHFFAAAQAEGAADARVKQAQIIVNFGGGSDGRARIARGILLADRNRGGDSGDFVHVRLFDAFQELPRVGRKRFDVAALAFGVERVERQAGFARAGNAADDRDGVVRDDEVNVLEVVDAGAADADLLDIAGDSGGGVRAAGAGRAAGNDVWLRLVPAQLIYRFRRHVCKPKIIRPTVKRRKSRLARSLRAGKTKKTGGAGSCRN